MTFLSDLNRHRVSFTECQLLGIEEENLPSTPNRLAPMPEGIVGAFLRDDNSAGTGHNRGATTTKNISFDHRHPHGVVPIGYQEMAGSALALMTKRSLIRVMLSTATLLHARRHISFMKPRKSGICSLIADARVATSMQNNGGRQFICTASSLRCCE